MNNKKNNPFTFNISLSVLNHLGRNLYRSFITVLGEAISNAWDADAENVWIYIDKEKENFVVKDDGIGMSENDFRNKFLQIGYSKRSKNKSNSAKGRPYIGRKGIGKLALLSCARKISVISKIESGKYVGGAIDNKELDEVIKDELESRDYSLGDVNYSVFLPYQDNHKHGTIIHFEKLKKGIKNTLSFLRELLALNFRFSLLDGSFNIFLEGDKITEEDLNKLSKKTEFLWQINDYNEKYKDKIKEFTKENEKISFEKNIIKGFIASVERPRDLKITNSDERVTVDLFTNGRLRVKDILKHITFSRVAESYLYGEIHFDELDKDEKDIFTSGREGIVADDEKYKEFLKKIKKDIFAKIIDDWDTFRRKHNEDGDPNNKNITKEERKSTELSNIVFSEYIQKKNSLTFKSWLPELRKNARFNFASYAHCFVSENLMRQYIRKKNIELSEKEKKEIKKWKDVEKKAKDKANISIDIRKKNDELNYLSMRFLASLIERNFSKENGSSGNETSLVRDEKEYTIIRNALAHTSLLTKDAKEKLNIIFSNLKTKLKKIFLSEISKK